MKFQALFHILLSLTFIHAQANSDNNEVEDTLLASCEKEGILIEFSSTVGKNVAVYVSGQGDSNIDGSLEQILDSLQDPVLIYEAVCGGSAPSELIAAVEEEKSLEPDLGDDLTFHAPPPEEDDHVPEDVSEGDDRKLQSAGSSSSSLAWWYYMHCGSPNVINQSECQCYAYQYGNRSVFYYDNKLTAKVSSVSQTIYLAVDLWTGSRWSTQSARAVSQGTWGALWTYGSNAYRRARVYGANSYTRYHWSVFTTNENYPCSSSGSNCSYCTRRNFNL